MPTTAQATARVIIEIIDDKARRAIDQTGVVSERTSRRVGLLAGRMQGLRNAFSVITKALLSMIGVLIAFNLLITLPQLILAGIVDAFRRGLEAIGDFQERVLSLQAVLATIFQQAADPAENFARTGRIAVAIVRELEERANEAVLGIDEMAIAMQVLATTSGGLIKSGQELVDVTILLSNAVAAVTTGQAIERQLSDEILSLMTGQFRATSRLVKIIFRNREEWERWMEAVKKGGDFAGALEAKLRPFLLASQALGQTFQGLVSTAETLLQVFLRKAFTGVFEDLRRQLNQIFKDMNKFGDLVDRLAATIGVSFKVAFGVVAKALSSLFGVTFRDTEDFMQQMTILIPRFVGTFAFLVVGIKNFLIFFKTLFPVISTLFDFIVIGFGVILTGVGVIRDAILNLIFLISSALRNIGFLFTQIFSRLPGLIGKAARGLGSLFGQSSKDLDALLDSAEVSTIKLGDRFTIVRSKFSEAIAEVLKRWAEFRQAQGASEAAAAAETAIFAGMADAVAKIKKLEADRTALQERLNAIAREDLTLLIEKNQELLREGRIVSETTRTFLTLLRLTVETGGDVTKIFEALAASVDATIRQIAALEAGIAKIEEILARFKLRPELFGEEQVQNLREQLLRFREMVAQLKGDLTLIDAELLRLFTRSFRELGEEFRAKVIVPIALGLESLLLPQAAKFAFSIKVIFTDLFKFVMANLVTIALAIGAAFADAITDILRGVTTLGEGLKRFFGNILVFLGQLLITIGGAALVIGIITGDLKVAVAGLKAIAIGIATVALGVALGGAGGRVGRAEAAGGAAGGEGAVREFAFNQALINVQQAANSLRDAASDLRDAFGGIKGMRAGDVLVAGADQKGGLTALVAKDASKPRNLSFSAQLGRVTAGGT